VKKARIKEEKIKGFMKREHKKEVRAGLGRSTSCGYAYKEAWNAILPEKKSSLLERIKKEKK